MQKNFIKTYDNIANKFAKSRKNMKWEEISYFVEKYFNLAKVGNTGLHSLSEIQKNISILDVWCWSWRLLEQIWEIYWNYDFDYLWVDLSPEMIEEARKNFSDDMFEVLDMEDLDKLEGKKFDFVFFIASFHHKKFLREREKTLKNLKKVLKEDSIVFMTNWALDSEINKEKYKNAEIFFTENDFENIYDFEEKQKEKKFWSKDFSIKFWEFYRYYHCFTLEELQFLFEENNFEIIENRLFDNGRNFISIFKNK